MSGSMRLTCVRLVPLFNQLAVADQELIARQLTHREFARGEVAIAPDQAGQLVIVERGQVRCYQLDATGNEQVLRVMGTGDYVGEQWLYGTPNEATYAVADQPTSACVLTNQDFNALLAASPQLASRLLQLTVARVNELTIQNHYLMMDSIEDRLRAYLARLSADCGQQTVTIPMKLKDLAAYLGTTPETLSRKLRALEAAGAIHRVRRQVQLKQIS